MVPAPTVEPGPASNGEATDQPLPAGLPPGVIELAADRWAEAETWADRAGLTPPSLDPDRRRRRLADELTAPLRLERWPAPVLPRRVAEGWLHDEVITDDRAAFEELLAGRADAGAEELAALAQQLRFPATPYRRPPPPAAIPHDVEPPHPAGEGPPPAAAPGARSRTGPVRVVDLTTHWAGPMATALLVEAGARVVKVDPECRPDGFRPRTALYAHLHRDKEIVDLDLRRPDDRARFEALVGEADLLVESFSRRVLPNLGYDPTELGRLNPGLAVVSIKSFARASAEADWLAYGPGVHAVSGLGLLGPEPRPAPIAYPDLVAGVTAYARAAALLAGHRELDADGAATVEVSLSGSIAPLVHRAAAAGEAGDADGDRHG